MYIIYLLIIFLLLGWLIFNTHFYKKTTHSLSFNLSNHLTVLHISDLHGKTRFINGRLSSIVLKSNPDILIITGDLVSRKRQLPSVMKEIKKIKNSGIKIYFTPGNYERETMNFFNKRAIHDKEYIENKSFIEDYMCVLENKGEMIFIKDTKINIYGFDNSIYGNERNNTCNLPSKSDLTFYLAHSPNIISYIEDKGLFFNFLFAGHTHGGQIRLFDKTVGPYKDFHLGLKKINKNQYFFITRGIGTVKIPFRINCYPEIAVFNIR
ncbi:metallophosphoesterase [Solibacillus sp. FSL R7-0682]|uniref:metallophosphoesterase n=1 Tax=Solibacillus sp. FSL R7-0682 TaxID=2921690 RepID=UPI0030F645F3